MRVHLVDGTYELFRHFYGAPSLMNEEGHERGAIVGVLGSVLGMLEQDVTHLGVATDHVIASFRNDLWPGYKTEDGIDPSLLEQFHPLEEALRAMGVVVWPMIELEADDALGSAAMLASRDRRAEQIFICTPDKDLSQCVVGDRVVQFDRRKRELRNEKGVIEKFGVPPASIPDYLAVVGDSADGFPGVRGWGAKSAGMVLGRYHKLESIPVDPAQWTVKVRGAARLAENLNADRDTANLFRTLATLKTDAPLFDTVDDLRWTRPTPEFQGVAEHLGNRKLWDRATRLARD